MTDIHFLHGCAPATPPFNTQSLRNYVSEEILRRYLDTRHEKYGTLSETAKCDALTVDDSTIGGARACVLAREAGHEVTLFINPAQIARQRPYWFSRLDAILDARTVTALTFEGQKFDLSSSRALRAFRLALKSRLMALHECDTDEALNEVTTLLRAQTAVIAEHARTLSLESLRKLVAQGVRIGSHGWDHRDIVSLEPDELVQDLRLTAQWIQAHLGCSPIDYAVPYGLDTLPRLAAQEVKGAILLANSKLAQGFLGNRHWNRSHLTAQLQGRPA